VNNRRKSFYPSLNAFCKADPVGTCLVGVLTLLVCNFFCLKYINCTFYLPQALTQLTIK